MRLIGQDGLRRPHVNKRSSRISMRAGQAVVTTRDQRISAVGDNRISETGNDRISSVAS